MKKTKKILAMLMAMSLIAGLSACGGDEAVDGGDDVAADATTTTAAVATTTAKTVEVNTETLMDEEAAVLEEVSAQLPQVSLDNPEVKYLAHYDLNPSAETGASKSVQLELFESNYGGYVKYYPSTWDTRYSDLSTYVLGGEGIDIFPIGDNPLPKGINNGMFQSFDEYTDLNDPIWANVKTVAEKYNFGGQHYALVTGATAENVCFYNTDTIDNNGFDDPWDLHLAGEWNWDTFKSMLTDFVDVDAEQYGLDGYWNEKALMASVGVPLLEAKDGHLICNIDNPEFEKAMNYQYELFTNNLVMDREEFGYTINPAFMGQGKELFYMVGSWDILKDPKTWFFEMEPEKLGIAPVPNPAGYDPYQALKPDGFVMCKDAGNPEGTILFVQCEILARSNEDAKAIGRRKQIDDYGLSEEFLLKLDQINQYALDYPVVEYASGASNDIASITTEGGDNVGARAPFHGVDWATEKARISEVLIALVAEVDAQIAEAQAAE